MLSVSVHAWTKNQGACQACLGGMLRIVWMYEFKSKHCRCSHLDGFVSHKVHKLDIISETRGSCLEPRAACSIRRRLAGAVSSHHIFSPSHVYATYHYSSGRKPAPNNSKSPELGVALQQTNFRTGGSTQRSVSIHSPLSVVA